jgi:hypothetical protein
VLSGEQLPTGSGPSASPALDRAALILRPVLRLAVPDLASVQVHLRTVPSACSNISRVAPPVTQRRAAHRVPSPILSSVGPSVGPSASLLPFLHLQYWPVSSPSSRSAPSVPSASPSAGPTASPQVPNPATYRSSGASPSAGPSGSPNAAPSAPSPSAGQRRSKCIASHRFQCISRLAVAPKQ